MLSALAAPVLAQSPHDEGIVELVADRLPPSTVVVLVDSAGSMLLPVEHVTWYLGLGRTGAARDILVPHTGGGTARLDTVTLRMVLPGRTVQLTPAELVRRGDVVFLRVEHVEALIEGEITVDFATLSVTFVRAVPFPAQQRIVADQRRAMVLARQRWLEQRAEVTDVPYQSMSGGIIADWEIVTYGLDPGRLTTGRGAAGLALFGGDLTGSGALEVGRDATQTVRDLALHYHRVFPRNRWVTQVRGGSVLTSGLFGRYVRGGEITNRPFLRSEELSSILVDPDLPPGWEYEVFQGNQLVGYSEVGSSDAVPVRLRSGTTPVQVRMYGPSGEEIVRTLLYQTPVTMLQRDAVEYIVGGGSCSTGCDEFAHADIRYGVSPLFTAGAGMEVISDSAGERVRPYFVYAMTSGTRVTAELAYMPFALYSANLGLYPREGTAAYMRGSVSRPGFGPITLLGEDRMRWDAELNIDERIDRTFPFSHLRIATSASGLTGTVHRWRVSAIGAFNRGYLESRYDHDNISTRTHLLTTRGAIFTPFSLRGRTLRPMLGAAVGMNDVGFQLAEISAQLQPTSASIISAGIQWSRGIDEPSVSLGYSARTGPVLAALRAISSVAGRASSLMLSGSASVSPHGDIAFHPSARTGYAGIGGVVFSDNDGDGVFGPGDVTVPGMSLVVGGYAVTADEHGRYSAWGLQPYQPAPVAIDSTRNSDPAWTTLRSDIHVRPVPNMARPFDIALVRTRELIGSLTSPDGTVPVGSVTLEITHLEDGDVTTTTTFSDGFFYVARLRPGRYRIAPSTASLDALGAMAEPAALEFEIPPGGEDAIELAAQVLMRRG